MSTLNSMKCKSCGLLGQPNGQCMYTGRHVNPEEDYCSKYTTNIQDCDLCGSKFVGPGTITQTGDELKITCQSCDNGMNTCKTCANAGPCIFHDSSVHPELPPVIVKRMQQGNAVMQAQVQNPDRVATVCPLCECFVEGWGCGREAHTCERYKIGWKE